MTDQTLQVLLQRLDHLTAEFQELRDGVKKAVRISDDDPEMALTRARKVLEYVIRDVFALRCQEDPGTRPLENLLQRLNKDGHLPKRLVAYASYIRDLGNVGTHVYGEELSKDDVRRSFENLTAILEWYFERVRPDAFMKVETPALIEDDPRPRLEEETLRREEQRTQERAREQEKTRRLQEEEARRRSEETERKRIEAEELKRLAEAEENARAKMQEPAQTISSGAGDSADRLVQGQEGKDPSLAPPSLRPAASRIKAAGIVCLICAVLLFVAGAGGLKAIVLFFIGLLLIGIHIGRRGSMRKVVYAVGPAPLQRPAHEQYQPPGAPQRQSSMAGALSGTLGKIIFGAICFGAICAFVALRDADLGMPFDLRIRLGVGALAIGVFQGLATGFSLKLIGRAKTGKVISSLIGLAVGIVVGLVVLNMTYSLRLHWYNTHDAAAWVITASGILGLFLGAVHSSKRTVR